ncbi:hypothetical protein C1Y40_04639 [Mycobacterium talmoniae]|uniref:Ig-like domain-containing protein n=1 Tax=Mycobacterium talmoniae TaxID=1858794 RepID=A0A2S8BEX5_9MYCO|nr:hypothetical protein C1Y40_04639 [Mycobacterium talmoniae]
MFVKDPSATLDYTVDWSAWMPSGDTIKTAAWTATTGLTVASSPAASTTATTATTFVSGGTAGQSYTLTCEITTTAGRTDSRSMTIAVQDL